MTHALEMTVEQPAGAVAVRSSDLLAVKANDSQKQTLYELHLFAGAGGGILGGLLLGHEPVCAVELEPAARKMLLQRQRDGVLPRFPIWDDVTTFDGNPWRGKVDVVCGGFPCQDISCAGKGEGLNGARSGLWGEMRRIAGEIRPRYIFVENSPMLTIRGLGRVLGDLAALGYNAAWGVLGANDAGGIHSRDRIWILANASETNPRPSLPRTRGLPQQPRGISWQPLSVPAWLAMRPRLRRMDDGVADWVDRLGAAGNGQVPAVAALAWQILDAQLPSNNRINDQ
jgi:DNA (cytosine-5)-methyltransferase 1